MKNGILVAILTIVFCAPAFAQMHSENESFVITYKNSSHYLIHIEEGLFMHKTMELAPTESMDHSVHLLGHVNLHFSYQDQDEFHQVERCPKTLLFMTTHMVEILENNEGELYCEIIR